MLLSSCRIFIFLYGVGVLLPVAHASTQANTLVSNTAQVDYIVSGVPGSTNSNVSSFRVDELISFTLVANNPSGVSVSSPQTGAVLSYTLSNQGNGFETFTLSDTQSVADDFDASTHSIFLDTNSNSTYDTGVDTLYSPGSNDPVLAMGASTHIFIVSDIPASLTGGAIAKLSLTANSATGTGPMGTVYPGGGDGGVDAVMGIASGTISVEQKYVVSTALANLVKTQSILDPNGGSYPVPNAVITYTLTLNVTGAGNLTGVKIADLVPAGSAYEANTLTLDSAPLTDAADLDAGVFTGTGIQVLLGTVTAPTTHTVTFKVRIQ